MQDWHSQSLISSDAYMDLASLGESAKTGCVSMLSRLT